MDDIEIFKYVLSTDELKRIIVDSINNSIKSKFEPLGRMISRIRKDGSLYYGLGVLNSDGNLEWGDLNRLNTNYTGLNMLKNEINLLLRKNERKDRIVFRKNLESEFIIPELLKIQKYSEEFKDDLYNEDSVFYKNLINSMNKIWESGKKYSSHFSKNFKTFFPTAVSSYDNDTEKGDSGDMFDGVDVILYFNVDKTKQRTFQVKKINKIEINDDGNYCVYVSMLLKKYRNVNAFVFYDNDFVYIFKINIDKITQFKGDENTFVFDSTLFLSKILYNDDNN